MRAFVRFGLPTDAPPCLNCPNHFGADAEPRRFWEGPPWLLRIEDSEKALWLKATRLYTRPRACRTAPRRWRRAASSKSESIDGRWKAWELTDPLVLAALSRPRLNWRSDKKEIRSRRSKPNAAHVSSATKSRADSLASSSRRT